MAAQEKAPIRTRSAKSRAGTALALPLLILASAGLWFWTRSHRAGAEAAAPGRVESTLHLETFVLNLADSDQRAYLRVGIDLGLNRQIGRGEQAPIAEVRDTILGVLGEARVDDLLTAAGKVKLKENLLRELQKRVPELGVEEVYFTEFLIQR